MFSLVPRCHGDLGSQGALLRLRKLLRPPMSVATFARAAETLSRRSRRLRNNPTTRVKQCRQPTIGPPERYEVNIEDRPRGMCRKVGFMNYPPGAEFQGVPRGTGMWEGHAGVGIIVRLIRRIIE